jgi:hypothetical protein
LPVVSECLCWCTQPAKKVHRNQEFKIGVASGKGHFFVRRLRDRTDSGVFVIGLPIGRCKPFRSLQKQKLYRPPLSAAGH